MKRLFSFPTSAELPFITERVQVLFTPQWLRHHILLVLSAPPHTQQGLLNDRKASLLQGQEQLQHLSAHKLDSQPSGRMAANHWLSTPLQVRKAPWTP